MLVQAPSLGRWSLCWAAALFLLALPAPSLAGPTTIPCQAVVDGTCLFNNSQSVKPDLVLDTQGHAPARITALFSSEGSLTISVNGGLFMDPQSKLVAKNDLSISTNGTVQVVNAAITGGRISLQAKGDSSQVNISSSSVSATGNVDLESSGILWISNKEASVVSSTGNISLLGSAGVQVSNSASVSAPTWKNPSAGAVLIQASCDRPLTTTTTTTSAQNTTTTPATSTTVAKIAGAAAGNATSLRFLRDSPIATDAPSPSYFFGGDPIPIVKVVIHDQAEILAGSLLQVSAYNVLVGRGAVLNSTDGDLVLGTSGDCQCGGGITVAQTVDPNVHPSLDFVSGTNLVDRNNFGTSTEPLLNGTLQGNNIHLTSSRLPLTVNDGFNIIASKSLVIRNIGGVVRLSTATPITTPLLRMDAQGNADVEADIQGPGAESLWSLDLRSEGAVTLTPAPGCTKLWNLDSAVIYGQTVLVKVEQLSIQGANTCQNNGTKVDPCATLQQNPDLLQYYSTGDLVRPKIAPADVSPETNPDVKFDFLVVATETINFTGTELRAASVMLCSMNDVHISDAKLDVSGRGCPAGTGPGTGEVPATARVEVGAGGGSHVVRGGKGAEVKKAKVTTLIDPGEPDEIVKDNLSMTSTLPTAGASGGGCTSFDVKGLCAKLPLTQSAGGGMIWVSVGNTSALAFSRSVNLKAMGQRGGTVTVQPRANVSSTSGGGSGGQILLFAGYFAVSDTSQVVINANGGDIGCTYHPSTGVGQIGGAGGGGFIALHQDKDFVGNETTRIHFMADGGKSQSEGECEPISIPKDELSKTYGKDGLVIPIGGCSPGREPPLCRECPLGNWSDGTTSCQDCTWAPAVAVYPYGGNQNSSCPYECPATYPSRASNNKNCYGPIRYYMTFYGGFVGFCCLLAVLGLLLLLLFCRGRKWCSCSPSDHSASSADVHLTAQGQMREWLWDSLLTIVLGSRFGRGVTKSSEFHFPKEHLPSHRFRLYFHGENRAGNRWCVDRKLPEAAEPLVNDTQWQEFVGRIHQLTQVSSFSRTLEVLLQYCYPPLAPVVARRFRIGRARQLAAMVRRTSDCEDMRSDFWKPIRARTCQRDEGLGIVFGCDAGASLGYLDFFDYSNSAMDYTVELVSQAFVLPTHGFGTWDDPFEIDAGDPLIAHITFTALGPMAVSRAIFDFNRASRVMWRQDVSCHSYMRGVLDKRIKRCIDRVDELRGVLAVMNLEEEYEQPEPRTILDSLLSPAGQGGGSPSFADLAERPVSRALSESSNQSSRQLSHSFRASLVFGNTISVMNPSEHSDGSQQSHSGFLTATVSGPVVSPLPAQYLRDQTSRRSFADQGQAMAAPPSKWKDACFRALSFPIPKCLSWTTGSETILYLLVILAFCDMLAYIVFVYMFGLIIGDGMIWYMMLPFPMLEPMSLILSAVFILLEYPVLGRVYASFVIFSLVPLTFGHLILLIDSEASRTFWILQWCLRVLIKFSIFSLTNFHIYTLLSKWDLNYMKVRESGWDPDDLWADSSRRMYASPSAASSFVPNSSFSGRRVSNSNLGPPWSGGGTFSSHPGAMQSMGSTSTYGGEAFQITQTQGGSRSPRSQLVWSGLPRTDFSPMTGESMRPRRSSRSKVDTRTPSPSRRHCEGSPF